MNVRNNAHPCCLVGSWIWKEVRDNLEVLDHVVHTPALNEGLSENNALRADGSLEGYVKFRAQPVTTQAFFDTASLESLKRGHHLYRR